MKNAKNCPEYSKPWFGFSLNTLGAKYTVAMTGLVVSIVVGMTWVNVVRERRAFRSELEQQAEAMLSTVVAMSSDAFYKRDFNDLDRFIDNLNVALEDNQFSFGRMYQTDGRVIADAAEEGISAHSLELDPLGLELLATNGTVKQWETDQLIVGRSIEIGGDIWGAVAIGLSTDPLEAKIAAVRRQGVYLALVSMAIGAILAQMLSRSITEPLRELTEVTKKLAAGNLQQSIEFCQERELQELGSSFNVMTQNIQTLVQELQEQAEVLRESEAIASEKAVKLQQALQELQTTQTQLVQSEKMVSLGQLVAGVAHEINNPVNFIHGNVHHALAYTNDLLELLHTYQRFYPDPNQEIVELMEEIELDFLEEDLSKLLKSMCTGTERIHEIVMSLKNFSRLDEAAFKAADIHEGIDNTLMILENRIKASGEFPRIRIDKQYGNIPAIDCFPGQLNQVFMNLLVNAVDALESKGQGLSYEEIEALDPHIKISTSVLPGHWLRVSIEDNAGGIPKDVQARLFDPFFTTKPIGKGTGLGLSISYKIITEKHFGHILCNSEMGASTEFVVIIPSRLQLCELPKPDLLKTVLPEAIAS